jgi:hypothetical protein
MRKKFCWKLLKERSFGGPMRKLEKNNTVYLMNIKRGCEIG